MNRRVDKRTHSPGCNYNTAIELMVVACRRSHYEILMGHWYQYIRFEGLTEEDECSSNYYIHLAVEVVFVDCISLAASLMDGNRRSHTSSLSRFVANSTNQTIKKIMGI